MVQKYCPKLLSLGFGNGRGSPRCKRAFGRLNPLFRAVWIKKGLLFLRSVIPLRTPSGTLHHERFPHGQPHPLPTCAGGPNSQHACASFSTPGRHRCGHSRATRHLSTMAIESVAFSGVDMPVHLVVHRPSLHRAAASRSLLVLDYPSFSRLLREKAPRSASIAVLTALGAQPIVDATSGCRNWVQVHIQDLLGTALTLSAAPVPQTQPIQPIAA